MKSIRDIKAELESILINYEKSVYAQELRSSIRVVLAGINSSIEELDKNNEE